MNYRHIYHAGNFADVFKHWILTLLLQKLTEKDTPFFILDTHAGLGIYDLQNKEAQKTLEHESGITKLHKVKLNPEFADLMRIVTSLNNDTGNAEQINFYPGSPYICQDYLRADDRLVLCELHPEDFKITQQNFGNDPRIKVSEQNGYAAMKALLPPLQGRGLVLIDPPFENETEFDDIVIALKAGLKRFAHGMYAIWYPIKDRKAVKRFYTQVRELQSDKLLIVEMHANTTVLNQLSSCGMVIVNAPWQLDTKLKANLPVLLKNFGFAHGTYLVE